MNVPRCISKYIKEDRGDKFNEMAEDIRHRSASIRDEQKSKSLLERVSVTKHIYPRDQLDYIRLNY